MKKLKHTLSVSFLWLAHKFDPAFINRITAVSSAAIPTMDVANRSEKVVIEPSPHANFWGEPSKEPSGIVYRPTAAELKKRNEDRATREGKEAIAETLKNADNSTI